MKKVTFILFVIILFEILLGGGGRLTAIGPLSLRMILFGLALASSALLFLQGSRLPGEYWRFVILFGAMLTIGCFTGIIFGNDHALLWEDVKPLLYFLILPFFTFAISSNQKVEFVSNTIKISSVIIASSFLFVLLLIHTSVIPFLDFYRFVIDTQEFFFRGQFTFFYKGFLFLPIGFIFFYFTKPSHKTVILIFLFFAIILTLTRGLLLALTLTFAAFYFTKSSFRKIALFVCFSFAIVFGGQYAISEGSSFISKFSSKQSNERTTVLLGDREYSDRGRWQQIKEVFSAVTPKSFINGHGFGQGVPSRPVHMEISYLEIFYKQGIIGLAVWGYLLWMLFTRWKVNRNAGLTNAFFFSSLFIFFQSLTNQYINNPIGLSWLLISLVCLDQLNSTREFSVS